MGTQEKKWTMGGTGWELAVSILLVILSILIYVIHYCIFSNARDIFFYMIMDVAFLPVQVLLVTLVIQRVLSIREKRERMRKLNMVIGAFFSELGTRLLTVLSDYDPSLDTIRQKLMVRGDWTSDDFRSVTDTIGKHLFEIDITIADLNYLNGFLSEKREFLIGLLENPSLLEHEAFTDLLWALLHLSEELSCRDDLNSLVDSDSQHIAGDLKRAYGILSRQWLAYMRHLNEYYPYLFSLAMRTNPFDRNASPVVR